MKREKKRIIRLRMKRKEMKIIIEERRKINERQKTRKPKIKDVERILKVTKNSWKKNERQERKHIRQVSMKEKMKEM